MEVYLELTYLINYIIYVIALEMMGILLNLDLAFKDILKQSLFLSSSLFLLYFDNSVLLVLACWLVIFFILYQRQVFLYYPVFMIVYFSLVFFVCSLVKEAMIFNGLLLVPDVFSYGGLLLLSVMAAVVQAMFWIYVKRKVRINSYLYPMKLSYLNQNYSVVGFLDSGNELYYQGFPLLLLKEGIINDYELLDIMVLNDLRDEVIGIIKINEVVVNKQLLKDVYVGIIKGIEYDCLLNKSLMGGVL